MKRVCALSCVLLAVMAWAWLELGAPPARIPSFEEARAAWRPSDARLLDRHGALIHEWRVDPRARRLAWTPIAAVSPALPRAVIASEDRRFHRHGGVDVLAIAAGCRAWLIGLVSDPGGSTRGPRLRGASTITMQLATLLEGGRAGAGPRSVAEKWRQIRQTRRIEARWSKPEILEAYLNLVTFRGELQGVSAASNILYGKAPHGLSESEALVLAVLLRAPGAGGRAVTRRALALARATQTRAHGSAIADAVARALEAPSGAGPRVALAPHAARLLLSGDRAATLRSTLDASLQRFAADALKLYLLAARGRRVSDGAVVVLDNATGDVLAYVGGSGDLSSARFVDGVRARRQAGSALKPFLYGRAFERGLLTPASLLADEPLDIPVAGGLYRPRNYDDTFQGAVSARLALGSSLNVPAVRALELVGADDFVRTLRDLGFAGLTEDGDFYGPSLALGSADVSLLELANAYRAIANGGRVEPIRMLAGEPVPTPAPRRVFTEATAFLLASILSDRESRSLTFGLENALATRFFTAVKTGTSKAMRDNWCVGFSERYTVGVWVGNFSGESMRDVSGVTGAAPVWREVMERLHRDAGSAPPRPPAGVTFAWVEPVPRGVVNPARILSPAPGAVIALDPDIPRARQRLVLEAEGGSGAERWRLDGADLGSAAAPRPWALRAGRHALAIVDARGWEVDALTFAVR